MTKLSALIFCPLLLIFVSITSPRIILAQDSPGSFYIPLIGLTSVPKPLALPKGEGSVTYNYAVKNFIREVPLNDVQVVDNKCSLVKFVTGDDNSNGTLDYDETWRYSCTTILTETTSSIATVTGVSNNITATHRAYTTVVVGSDATPPLVSIINITKVAYPLSLPKEGGEITFTYKVNNPGVVPLSGVKVTDNKCKSLSGKLGDTNGNNLLDTDEVWIYTCTTVLRQTTSNTVSVEASANGLKAVDDATITVKVDTISGSSPQFPNVGNGSNLKSTVWKILASILAILVVVSVLTRKGGSGKSPNRKR